MTRLKYILRAAMLLLIVIMLINLFRKTESNMVRIAEFKIETLNKIKADSLNTERKLDLFVDETVKFNKQLNEDAPQINEALQYLIAVVVMLIALELFFFISRVK